jgi:1-acyl-sn-glycerol-3-phosphate acyltransferase
MLHLRRALRAVLKGGTLSNRDATMWLVRKACLGLLRAMGWRTVLVWPPEPHGLILVYPHTSNWDFIIGVLFRVGRGLPAHWMGKDSMFRWPFRGLLRRIGGVPINRRERTGFIDSMLDEFRRRDWLWLAVAPEGTRAHTDHLKTGFYQIARAANLPIGLAYMDYGRRCVGIDTYVRMTGDEAADLETLRAYYADKRACVPAAAGDLRFRPSRPAQ